MLDTLYLRLCAQILNDWANWSCRDRAKSIWKCGVPIELHKASFQVSKSAMNSLLLVIEANEDCMRQKQVELGLAAVHTAL